MNCLSCGHPLLSGDTNCSNCGTHVTVPNAPLQPPTPVTPVQQTPLPQEETSQMSETVNEVSHFFKNSFLSIVKSIITKPIQGTHDIFKNAGPEAYQQALILIGTTGAVYFLMPMLFFGRYLGGGGAGEFFKVGLIVIILLLVISVLTYLIKSVSGKPDFKRELLTGGICGIPLMIFILYTTLEGGSGLGYITFGSGRTVFGGPGILSSLVVTYTFLMLINIIQQSLKATDTNDAVSWYLAPVILIISGYIGISLMRDMLTIW